MIKTMDEETLEKLGRDLGEDEIPSVDEVDK